MTEPRYLLIDTDTGRRVEITTNELQALIWRMELHDAVAQLERQTVEQRIEELQAKNRDGGLDEADKYELRALLQARIGRG